MLISRNFPKCASTHKLAIRHMNFNIPSKNYLKTPRNMFFHQRIDLDLDLFVGWKLGNWQKWNLVLTNGDVFLELLVLARKMKNSTKEVWIYTKKITWRIKEYSFLQEYEKRFCKLQEWIFQWLGFQNTDFTLW